MSHLYQVHLDWTHDRNGLLKSDVLEQTIRVVTPPEFPKGIAGHWSPEHLFVAAINSCLMTTFLAVAENSGLEFTGFACNATGTLEKTDGKFRITQVVLEPVVTIADGNLSEKAKRVIEISEKACLISNSVNSEIIVRPKIQF